MTSAETQVLLRNEARIFDGPGHTLIVDPPDLETTERLAPHSVELWVRHHGVARILAGTSTVHTAAVWSPPPDRFGRAIVFLPKGRRLQQMTLHQLAAALPPGTPVWIVGANRVGIKSAAKALSQTYDAVTTVDSARRCTLLEARTPSSPPVFQIADWTTRWTARVDERAVEVHSLPGTFSDGELDVGTAELIAAMGASVRGPRVLDLCCGCGVIGTMIARAHPRFEVLLVDAQAAAVASTNATVAHNDLVNATCVASDWYSDVDGTFDAIVCNPPFHSGIATDTSMIDHVIAGARIHLRPQGELWLVANRFLPYTDRLQATFQDVGVVRDTTRFRVYRCRKPRSGR